MHLLFDLLRHVGDHRPLELTLNARLVQQIGNAADAQRVVEEGHAAVLELVQDVVDLRQTELELAREVRAIDAQLTLDVVDGLQVLAQQLEPPADRLARGLGQAQADAERIQQLQAQALALIERRRDVAFEIGELIAVHRPRRAVAELRAQRVAGGHAEHFRLRSEQRLRVLRDEALHLLAILGALEHVDLVDDDDDLLAPVADVLEKRALALGERAIRGRDEEHEVRLRHELGRQPFVLAEDRVGARRVDDVEIAEQRDGRGDDIHGLLFDVAARRVAVAQDLQPRRRGRGTFFEHTRAGQRIDERALAGVELADHDEQEQPVELGDRAFKRRLIRRRRPRSAPAHAGASRATRVPH